MARKGSWRLRSQKTERFTIWDNYERHTGELAAIGATPDELAELKSVAEKVAEEEDRVAREKGRNPAFENSGLPEITAPHTCSNGWVVAPPTLVAKRWASMALLKVTGGEPPQDALATSYAVIAGLWALKTWGDGQKDRVMQTVMADGALASLLPQIEEQFDIQQIDQVAADFQLLMGQSKKNSPALQQYQQTLSKIRRRHSGPSTPGSSPPS